MLEFSFSVENFEYWLLILVRVSAFCVTAPLFSEKSIPGKVKIGLSACLAILLYGVVDRPVLEYETVVGYAIILVKEGITGLLIGFAANICNSIVLFAGNIIDMDIGLSMASEFNPDMNMQVTISGNFYYYIVFLLLIISDMHLYILRALCDSYQLVPINGVAFQRDHLLATMVQFMGDLFVIGFRIFLPYFACIMILNCILGVMAKVAPQMNMFSVGMQLKVLVGLVVMLMVVFLFPRVAEYIYDEIRTMVVLIIEGLHEP